MISTQVDHKSLYGVKFTSFCNLHELGSRPTNPFGHRLQFLVLKTCVDLHRLASPFVGLVFIILHFWTVYVKILFSLYET